MDNRLIFGGSKGLGRNNFLISKAPQSSSLPKPRNSSSETKFSGQKVNCFEPSAEPSRNSLIFDRYKPQTPTQSPHNTLFKPLLRQQASPVPDPESEKVTSSRLLAAVGVALFVLVCWLSYGQQKQGRRSYGMPFCLTDYQFYQCRKCPRNAVCLAENEFTCLPGFVSNGEVCVQDIQARRKGEQLAVLTAQQISGGCIVQTSMRHLARKLNDQGNLQIQVVFAMKLLRSGPFIRRFGLEIVETGDDYRLRSKNPGSCSRVPGGFSLRHVLALAGVAVLGAIAVKLQIK